MTKVAFYHLISTRGQMMLCCNYSVVKRSIVPHWVV
jgi:hypothetical protein